MPRYTIVIQYDTLQAYQRHGGNMEELTKQSFLAKGAIEQTLFISTRSLPPIHTTSFYAPDHVCLEDLTRVNLGDGVRFDIHKEA
ncbi:hypothetical protein P175DRAFT_0461032 [Aspergillus ochraceoroseus IBT 24754]|uniref:EthD domain-containing protein n=1 Tax=Aspergillus ochraceoroseus IBT 24754 TaxID=1392256 RepID=A0A2T5LVL1_9EURO|nr:uncharacterized protein P175DRAFT_0461032 [Aspergillus ochraceoroseus IBT 24754]PTU20321.1 hypothetical protein P175DRAFT_0461032 [Aspergillus ochraceoroseus IBT 24754]